MMTRTRRSAGLHQARSGARGCLTLLAIAGLLVTASSTSTAATRQLEGVTFAQTIETGPTDQTPLVLNGLGLMRYRVLFRGYVAALYLAQGTPPSKALEDVARRIEIEYFWSLTAARLAKVTIEGIEKNVPASEMRALEPRIRRFNALYRDIAPGDRYALTYTPGRGTELALNGRALGTIEGADFGRAVFAIWLGTEPFDANLKDELLNPKTAR
jgi:hypothetical protein